MTKEEALELLRAGRSSEWNSYRRRNPKWIPDLRGVDLKNAVLVPEDRPEFDLSGAILFGVKFPEFYRSPAFRRPLLKDAVMDLNTKFPASFDPGAFGVKYIAKHEVPALKVPEQFRVFISYAWANEGPVLAIDQWLRIKGVSTHIDRRDFFAGSRIRDEILRIMTGCNVVLVFYSKLAAGKPWPEFERELAADIQMTALQEGREAARVVYAVLDETPLPSPTEKNRVAIMAKGKRFELVCEEIYHSILQLPKVAASIDLTKWSDYNF